MQRAGTLAADTLSPIAQLTKEAQEGTIVRHRQTAAGNVDCLASLIVPRATSSRDIIVLETAMQGLALDKKHPVALELAATADSRHFLLRATSRMSLQHLADQVQARYPQAIIQLMSESLDPFMLKDGETVSAIELHPGAAAYLPLRALRERELQQEGADPLLGILGVCNHLPPHMRVVTQVALLPASPTWSRAYRRKSVEHPLEQERLQSRRELSGTQMNSPSTFRFMCMGALVAVLLVWLRFKRQLDPLVPAWLLQAGVSLLHGKTPQFSSAHLVALEIGGGISLVVLFCLALLVLQVRNRLMTAPVYDMRLVDEKTARPAYRVRLRLFVFCSEAGTVSTHPVFPAQHTRPTKGFTRRLFQQPFAWSHLQGVYNSCRDTAYRDEQRRQE